MRANTELLARVSLMKVSSANTSSGVPAKWVGITTVEQFYPLRSSDMTNVAVTLPEIIFPVNSYKFKRFTLQRLIARMT
jgi:hypothetical protein